MLGRVVQSPINIERTIRENFDLRSSYQFENLKEN